jgi:tetratricopeptide (TPR) repeat protein
VAVAEGRVRVHHGRRTWTVEAGEALLWNPVTPAIRPIQVVAMMQLFEPPAQIDAVEPPSVSDAKPWDVSEVKRQIVSGDANGAIQVLQEHLRSVPDDAEAWSLLADAHLRNGAKKQAVVSWKRSADHANPAAASQARFKAAAVLSDEGDWSSAAELYRRVLDGRPGALALDARLGLGESLLRSGQLELGRSTLIGLVSDQPASSPAKQASVVLSEFQGQE